MKKLSKPKISVANQDGNIFAIIGTISRELKRKGDYEKAKEMCERIMSSGSYDEALAITFDYVDWE